MKIMIFADEGKVLTDGTTYGTTVSLGEGRKSEEFYEITRAEYEKRMAEQEAVAEA